MNGEIHASKPTVKVLSKGEYRLYESVIKGSILNVGEPMEKFEAPICNQNYYRVWIRIHLVIFIRVQRLYLHPGCSEEQEERMAV